MRVGGSGYVRECVQARAQGGGPLGHPMSGALVTRGSWAMDIIICLGVVVSFKQSGKNDRKYRRYTNKNV